MSKAVTEVTATQEQLHQQTQHSYCLMLRFIQRCDLIDTSLNLFENTKPEPTSTEYEKGSSAVIMSLFMDCVALWYLQKWARSLVSNTLSCPIMSVWHIWWSHSRLQQHAHTASLQNSPRHLTSSRCPATLLLSCPHMLLPVIVSLQAVVNQLYIVSAVVKLVTGVWSHLNSKSRQLQGQQ